MKLEKVLRNARNALIGVGLSGALLLGAGCETMNTADWLAFIAGTTARDKNKTEEQRKSAAYLEQIAKEQAKRQHERDIADRSRDETKQEVNVYIGEQEKEADIRAGRKPPENYVEKKEKQEIRDFSLESYSDNILYLARAAGDLPQKPMQHYFTCNYGKDFNNNNQIDYPDEYVGIKNKFRDNEKIILVSRGINLRGHKLGYKIYNPSGEIIHENELILSSRFISEMRIGKNFDMTNWLIQNGGYGNFKAVWYLDDQYNGSTEFEIVPSE